MKNIKQLLVDYINDHDNPEKNFDLAVYYHNIGQTATAVSYYLRTAERTSDPHFKYESLFHAAECFDAQGSFRKLTVKNLLKQAITVLPERPEAYWMLSKVYESEKYGSDHWFDSYMAASLGVNVADNPQEAFRKPSTYPGKFAVLFQKAHAAWHSDLCDESRDIFLDLYQNYKMDEIHTNAVKNNLDFLSTSYQNLHPIYNSESKKNFLYESAQNQELNGFDWGLTAQNQWFKETVEKEVFEWKVYEKFHEVKAGDIVFDIGSSVGPFVHSIRDKKAKKIICLEPHKELFQTLSKNTKDIDNVTLINKGIGITDGKEVQYGLFDADRIDTAEEENGQEIDTISWRTLLKENEIDYIDFMKIDCEGGEYDIFTEENFEWISNNVRYITGEWHLDNKEFQDKFRKFRDTYLSKLKFKITSFDSVDITDTVWDDWFIDYYNGINVYIDNTAVKKKIKNKHQYSVAPTMEITTCVPEKGCTVDCVFCPQRTLTKQYKGTHRLTLDKFKYAIDKIPEEVRITFAGFTEPWLNKQCTDMLLYAHEKGHPISTFTTLVGVSIDDLERIKHVPFAGNPNGGFTVHLPDQELRAKHPINKKYIQTAEHLAKIQSEIQNFTIMSMGTVHEKVRHVFPDAPVYDMWSRAGNLIGEAIIKPELQKEFFNTIDHGTKDMTCGCPERLYHNIMLPNGDISLCCMDYSLDAIIGNIFEQEYNEVIPDPYSTYDICRKCENAIDVNSLFIQSERKQYNV